MSVSVSRSLAYVEQGRSTCNVSRSLSPSSFFASQRVPVTAPDRREFCRSLANSLAKSIKNHGENRSRETPRGTQNRLKIGPGTLSGHPVASKSVPKASRERLGSVPERPRRAPGVPQRPWRGAKGAPGRQKGRPGAPGSMPRRPKSTPSRVREGKNRVFHALQVRDALSERFFVDFR